MPHSFIAFSSFIVPKISNINLCTTLITFRLSMLWGSILMIGANHKISFMIFRQKRHEKFHPIIVCFQSEWNINHTHCILNSNLERKYENVLLWSHFLQVFESSCVSLESFIFFIFTLTTCIKQLNYTNIYLIWVTVTWCCFLLSLTSKVNFWIFWLGKLMIVK